MQTARHSALLLLIVLMLLNTSCAKRFTVFRAENPSFSLDVSAYYINEDDLDIGFDFWSENGIPLITILNQTDSTALLLLEQSQITSSSYRTSLGAELELHSPILRVGNAYPNLRIANWKGKRGIELPPKEWISFYGAPSPTIVKDRAHAFNTLNYKLAVSFSPNEKVRYYDIGFSPAIKDKLSRKDFESFKRLNASPNAYYSDNRIEENVVFQIAFELISLLLAFSVF